MKQIQGKKKTDKELAQSLHFNPTVRILASQMAQW